MESQPADAAETSMERGLSELSDALQALIARPDDPQTGPSGLLRLVRLMTTLAEPDDLATLA